MRLVKIGFANVNTTVGALTSNTDKVIARAAELSQADCTIGGFAEQVISGYPVEDLVQWRGFVDAQWHELQRFAEALRPSSTVFTLGLTVREGGHVYNSVAVVQAGNILGIVPKEKLPLYEVFYERRTFSSGIAGRVGTLHGVPFGDLIFTFSFGRLAVEVCEDLWSPDGPMRRRAYSGAEIVVNASASPWRAGILETRRELISTRAWDNQVTLVYVNQVGGQDALVFDGGGFVNQNGTMLTEAIRWKEGVSTAVVDLDRTTRLRQENTTWRTDAEVWLREHLPVSAIPSSASVTPASASVILNEVKDLSERTLLSPPAKAEGNPIPRDSSGREDATFRMTQREAPSYFDELLTAMKTGLAGYFEKTGAFERIGIALSGGKDSALTLFIAWLYAKERFGNDHAALRDFIHCFSMPTRYNTDTTRSIARELCHDLGVTFHELSIEEAFARELAATQQMLGEGGEVTSVTRQNIQARLRAMRMWNWANSAKALWLQTGNMSEKAVGYTTVGGDLMGGYSLLGNLPKTVVIALLQYLQKEHEFPSLAKLMATKASAELEDDQEDERDLMPFEVLDACFALFAGEKLTVVELYRALRQRWSDDELAALAPDYRPGMLKEWVNKFARLFVGSIYKWVQAPQAVHLGTLDLDRERALQLPVVQSTEWLELEKLDQEKDEG